MRFSNYPFSFQYFCVSLRSCSSCLPLLPRLSVLSIFPSTTYFRRKFLLKICPIRSHFFHFILVGYISPSWLYVIFLYFSHDQYNRSSPSLSSTKLQNFQRISGIISEMSYREECFILTTSVHQLWGSPSVLLVGKGTSCPGGVGREVNQSSSSVAEINNDCISGSVFWNALHLYQMTRRQPCFKYRVIHKSLRDFRTRLRNNQDTHGRKGHINR